MQLASAFGLVSFSTMATRSGFRRALARRARFLPLMRLNARLIEPMGTNNVDSERQEALLAENARLRRLLEEHGIPLAGEVRRESIGVAESPSHVPRSPEEKVALFRRLFRGRSDVYPLRWEGKNGRSGYAPACANEWKPGICEKPRIKCADCPHRAFLPVTDEVIYKHLTGQHTVGVYPLLTGDTCWFLAVDFDEADWRDDVTAFRSSCEELGVPVAVEVSRSGSGAHAWIFFETAVPARDARRLGTAVISHTCARIRQLKLASYDRFFPSQDAMPKGGFGNLIALPLQKAPRERGCSVFVDRHLIPFDDQWEFLATLKPMTTEALEEAVQRATGGAHPLDVSFIADEDYAEPWKQAGPSIRIAGSLPEVVTITAANQLYFEKAQLPQPLMNRLVRLAAFQNPEFYRAQAMRLPVWNKPRVIGCAENFPKHIAIPRGCLDAAMELLGANDIRGEIRDERFEGARIQSRFLGTLRPDQAAAARAVLKHDVGVLSAPTAFGKTVLAASVIARRSVNTLILVHRTELLKQWKERLLEFLDAGPKAIGVLGGGRFRPTSCIDIAVMQSLSHRGQVDEIVEQYGQIIVDECHHVSAVSFEAILRRAKAKYVLGLTATPIRRDGQQAIIFMQCGPIRHQAKASGEMVHACEVHPRFVTTRLAVDPSRGIQDVFRQLTSDRDRNEQICSDVRSSYVSGRRMLVLTERTEHVATLQQALKGAIGNMVVLHGRMGKKERAQALKALNDLAPESPRVLLATGRLIGEGFDHPPLDTLVLAMPISWRGTLQQYAGRLHRAHDSKKDVRIHDYVDPHPATRRMWEKRQAGYRTMGYAVKTTIDGGAQLPLT